MPRTMLNTDVFQETVNRLVELYETGARVVVSFSAGKDSGICLEMAVIAAQITGRGPVDVVMRDEEVMFPGTYEYAERVAARDDVNFHWIYARQPIVNVFNRENPYWWVFDPLLSPDEWMRKPPAIAYQIDEKDITAMNTPTRFPPDEGCDLVSITGLRIYESRIRRYSIHSSGGHMTKPQKPFGVRNCRPIYDWTDGDVWRAIQENGWDYNTAYNVLHRHGVRAKHLRIGPPTMNREGADLLRIAQTAWPRWFDRLAERVPGVRTIAQYGLRAVSPDRRLGESWKETFDRECVAQAPDWIAERASKIAGELVPRHSRHSTTPFPDSDPCNQCLGNVGSWKKMTQFLYTGDPLATRFPSLGPIEPEFFRAGAGTWGGKPSW